MVLGREQHFLEILETDVEQVRIIGQGEPQIVAREVARQRLRRYRDMLGAVRIAMARKAVESPGHHE